MLFLKVCGIILTVLLLHAKTLVYGVSITGLIRGIKDLHGSESWRALGLDVGFLLLNGLEGFGQRLGLRRVFLTTIPSKA